jgi:glycosyltransferase involved in cell wall biosynthesis
MAPHAQLAEWTSGATIGVIPYENVGLNHWNCSPNKIWEYPNAGVPILASRLNYLSSVIADWDIGWTLSSDPNVSDIVSFISAINDQDLEEKRAACRRFIEADNYTLHEKRLLNLVHRLAA